MMLLIDCNEPEHAHAILAIFNHAIVNSTALFDYQPRLIQSMQPWFEAKRFRGDPVIGAVDDCGTLIGFASYGPFRAWPAYKYTVEHCVYVHHAHRGRGVGDFLLGSLIERAIDQNHHVLVGGIEASNTASIRLHEKHGFEACGRIRHAGFKFGRWLDLAFYQRILPTPAEPREG